MRGPASPEFVVVGHATLDRFDDDVRPGGAALYAAVTAHRLGLSVGVLTSHGPDFPLEALPSQIEVVTVEAPVTTAFEHVVRDERRRLHLVDVARPLTATDLPEDWRDADIALLAPVADEVDPALASAFTGAAVGAGIQGWIRVVAPDGTVGPGPWRPASALLDRMQALFVGSDDVDGRERDMLEWLQRVPLAVMTAGARGALLYVNGDRFDVRPRPARAVDPTGAGDVFAAAFLVHYHRHGDPWQAAEVATCAASLSVEGEGWSSVPDLPALERALAEYRREAA